MRILVINPNSTVSMTTAIAASARRAAGSGTTITAVNPKGGPPAIEGPEDGTAALPGLNALFDREIEGNRRHDAVVIACFDDTGLLELRRRSPVPVLGIGEAAFHAAMLLGDTFSVVTTLPVSVGVIEDNLRRYGFAARCRKVRASGVPVLALESDPAQCAAAIGGEIERALAEDDVDSIALGCAGMTDLSARLTASFGVPVIDGVAAAIGLCEALDRAGHARRKPTARADASM